MTTETGKVPNTAPYSSSGEKIRKKHEEERAIKPSFSLQALRPGQA
jgi:hypothetical protein